jgi:hypothetical protein
MMRTTLVILFIILYSNIYSQEWKTDCKDIDRIIELEQQGHKHLLDFRANPLTQNYDLKYHRLEWEVDPAVQYITGRVTSHFIPKSSGFLVINFDFASNMTVNQVLYHGNAVPFSQAGIDNLSITFPSAIPMGVLDSVTVEYEGEPIVSGFGSFRTGTHDGTPVLWTLSEPYGAKIWWPCKQDLTDKIDAIDVIVTTPSAYRVASNGILAGETAVGTNKIYRWEHRYPIPAYLIAIGVTNYSVFSDFADLEGGGSVEILNYVYPESLTSAETNLVNTVEIMELFNTLFGNYPFADEKYGHAQFGFGGGMEHQTMSFMGGFSYDLQAHELAHQWFGDKITCGTWEDIWLNEGFATYLTGLTKEHLGTEAAWDSWRASLINNITSAPDGSVWVDDTTSVGRIFNGRLSYNKGAMVLHMLRWKLGDTQFYQAINNYLEDATLAFGYAKTEDLQSHLEAVSGMDLTEFFNDWIYGQGYPSYQLAWSDQGSGVRIELSQTTSHASVPFFEMPVPVLVSGNGQEMMLTLDHNINGQIFEIELPFTVTSVSLDPDQWLISKNNTVVLPVEWLDFKLSVEKSTVLLEWSTASEVNNDYFDIQRSSDGIQWTSIGEVDGAGTSHKILTYKFKDLNPGMGENYYRIVQVDYDGASHASETISAYFFPEGQIKIFPNPVVDYLNIVGRNFTVDHIKLSNAAGEIIQLSVQKNQRDNMVLDMKSLHNGIYILQIGNQVHKIVVNH